MKISSIMGRVNTLLKDTAWLRWPKSELLDYFNDAIRAIILIRPDAGASNEVITCVPGTKQSLPAGAIRLLDVIRLVDGRAIKPVPRDVLDTNYPDWHDTSGAIERYIYNERIPKQFFVFPGAEGADQIDAILARVPPEVLLDNIDSAVIPIDDLYVNPVIDWMMYRAFSKDAENGANSSLAAQHYQGFAEQLGMKQGAEDFEQQVKQSKYTGGAV